ncbi:MAG: sugar phosphate isomerase/epimerase [Ferruginibacter sp.]|nr:sugar phosphate isomerase/epimerase [Cytophagales bacterium]
MKSGWIVFAALVASQNQSPRPLGEWSRSRLAFQNLNIDESGNPGGYAPRRSLSNPFFVFNNGVKDEHYDTPEEQVRLAKEAGFKDMEKNGLDQLPETLRALDANGLKLRAMYVNVDLDNPQQPYDPRLRSAFEAIRGRGTMPWFYLTSKKYPPSSAENDSVAVSILRKIAALADQYGVRIMVYPHLNYWLESVQDGLRVVEKVDRPNVGMTFNLCHFLAHRARRGQPESLASLIRRSTPRVFAISLNGADSTAQDPNDPWASFIKPLGEGNFDTYQYLKAFLDAGFRGPVGLQCYAIREEKPTHLRQSIRAWQAFQTRYRTEKTKGPAAPR